MILKQWSPQMKLVKEQFDSISVWAQFYDVPLELWSDEDLSYIASAIGNPLYADSQTESHQRLNYAKICNEVEYSNGNVATIVLSILGLLLSAWNAMFLGTLLLNV